MYSCIQIVFLYKDCITVYRLYSNLQIVFLYTYCIPVYRLYSYIQIVSCIQIVFLYTDCIPVSRLYPCIQIVSLYTDCILVYRLYSCIQIPGCIYLWIEWSRMRWEGLNSPLVSRVSVDSTVRESGTDSVLPGWFPPSSISYPEQGNGVSKPSSETETPI